MNVIQQLPDSIANQIAAGEVVQRPSSVVKELMENSVDAGATQIKVVIYDAGKTLIQVSDNGCGMSDIDARMSIERHATSKIRTAEDLYRIRTLGFRGEALASIASVSNLTIVTRRADFEVGTEIQVSGGVIKSQTTVACAVGSVFSVKNLFFNIPARRKFLKSDQTEFRHITDEFIRVAIINPSIGFTLYHNDQLVFDLPPGSIKQRIINIMGRGYDENLIQIRSSSPIVTIEGFIGNPRFAKKTGGDQYFFVNNRFMRHPFFHRAVMNAYEGLLAEGALPAYFISFTVDPETIDVNIHPTKTEIKFEYERDIFQMLQSAVKESLGKFSFMPSIDFDNSFETTLAFQPAPKGQPISVPEVKINPNYNPFKSSPQPESPKRTTGIHPMTNWNTSVLNFEKDSNSEQLVIPFENGNEVLQRSFIQLKKRYILTSVKSGLMIIDQHRAHFQILYEELSQSLSLGNIASQSLMFPLEPDFDFMTVSALESISEELTSLGFKLGRTDGNNIQLTAIPAILSPERAVQFLEKIGEMVLNSVEAPINVLKEQIVQNLAAVSAVSYGETLSVEEMCEINDRLFSCNSPALTCDGKKIIQTLTLEEITELFNKP